MWELLAPGYGLLYEHVDIIGGVTRGGGLSGLKCWNSDNLFDWIEFFKTNKYFYFFDESQNVKQKPRNFLETRSCSLWRMLISVNQNAERERSVREKERGRILIALNFIRETFLCSLNLFSCAQPILIAWTSCLKLIISKLYSAEATTLNENIHKLRIATEKNIEFNFFRTLICIT